MRLNPLKSGQRRPNKYIYCKLCATYLKKVRFQLCFECI